jgi:hypothetical protein
MPAERENMKTYYIYNIITDEFLGTVKASDSIQAELKALDEIEKTSLLDSVYIAAFSERQ